MTEVRMQPGVTDGATYETVRYPNDEIRLRVVTGGNVQVVEYRSDDRDGPPAHTHEWDEVEYVIEGHVEFLMDGKWTAGGPGTVQMLPRGVPHSVRVPDGDARVLMITIGPPYDQFARELSEVLAASGYADPTAVVGVAERHGVRLG